MSSAEVLTAERLACTFKGVRKEGILPNILLFCRILKRLKINITTGRVLDVFKSLKHINICEKEDLYYILRANLISCCEDIPIFDRAFRMFWDFCDKPERSEADYEAGKDFEEVLIKELHMDEIGEGDSEEDPDSKAIYQYSPIESLSVKDFSAFTDEEVEKIKDVVAGIANKLATKKSRRWQTNPKGRDIHPMGTLRKSMEYGGEILDLAKRKKKIKKMKLVALADVSGSMDCYSNFFVQFMYGMQNRLKGVETFVFSTCLTRITELLKNRSIDEALKEVSKIALHWSGGTKIGLCLKSFNDEFAPFVLDNKAIPIIISDGWDRGDTELLEREIKTLKRNCGRIIWLNPLLSSPDYQPLCKGIECVLPHITHFLPFYNLNSLIALGKTLDSIT